MGGNFRGVFLPPIFPLKLIEIERILKTGIEKKFRDGKENSLHSSHL